MKLMKIKFQVLLSGLKMTVRHQRQRVPNFPLVSVPCLSDVMGFQLFLHAVCRR